MHTHVQNVHTVVENNLKHYKELFGKICYCNTEKYPFVMATTGATTVISKKISSKNVIIEISDGLANGNSMLF